MWILALWQAAEVSVRLDRDRWAADEPVTGTISVVWRGETSRLNGPHVIVSMSDVRTVIPHAVRSPVIGGQTYEIPFSVEVPAKWKRVGERVGKPLPFFKPGRFRLAAEVESRDWAPWTPKSRPQDDIPSVDGQWKSGELEFEFGPAGRETATVAEVLDAARGEVGDLKGWMLEWAAREGVGPDRLAEFFTPAGGPLVWGESTDERFFVRAESGARIEVLARKPGEFCNFNAGIVNVALLSDVTLDIEGKPGLYAVKCDVHGDARGWLLVDGRR